MGLVSLLAVGACDRRSGEQAEGDTSWRTDISRDATVSDTADTAVVDGRDGDATGTEGDVADATDGCDAGDFTGPDGGCRPLPEGTPASACPSGRYAGESLFRGDGVCLPAKPRTTGETDCPSGEYVGADAFRGNGICRPQLPKLEDWTCTGGWKERPAFNGDRPKGLEGVDLCVPPDLPDSCARGTFAPAGASTCQRHGTACPTGDQQWLATSKLRSRASRFSGDLHYVTADQGSDGTGARNAPFHSVDAAVAAASDGDIVALGTGTHRTTVDTEKRLAFLGACVAETTVEPPTSADPDRILDVEHSRGATIANLAVTGPAVGVYIRDPVRDVHLANLLITEARGYGIDILGNPSTGAVDLERVAVRKTQPTDSGRTGYGLDASYSPTIRVRESVFVGNHERGVHLNGANALDATLVDSVIRRTQPRPIDGKIGFGLHVAGASSLELKRTILQRNRQKAIYLHDKGTHVDLVQSAIRQTRRTSESFGSSIEVADGARLSAERLLVESPPNYALKLRAGGRATSLRQIAIIGRSTPPSPRLAGLSALSGASLQAEQLLALNLPNKALIARDDRDDFPAPTVELSNSVVRQTGGVGITAERSEMRLNRVLVEKTGAFGVKADGPSTRLHLADLSIRKINQTLANRGLLAVEDARVSGTRIVITRVRHAGLAVAQGDATTVDLRHVLIANSSSVPKRTYSFDSGFGAVVKHGGTLRLQKALVEDHPDAGIILEGNDSQLDFRDGVVRQIRPATPTDSLGIGIASYEGADLTLRRVAMRDNHRTDLDIHHAESRLDIQDLSIRKPGAPDTYGTTGYGLSIGGDPTLADITRVHTSGAVGVGLYLKQAREIRLRDLVVEETIPDSLGLADGLYAFHDASLKLDRAVVADNDRHGLVVSNAAADLADLALVRNGGAGIAQQGEVDVEFSRLRTRDNADGRVQCNQQCYESPPETERVTTPSDL